jgi:broad specificity phosphatase PhoE
MAASVVGVAATILLTRHGESDWNRELRWQGHADRPLTEAGRDQARALAAELAGEPISAVYSSDLIRAHETARIVADRLGLEVTVIPDLREIDVGAWSGLTRDEIAHHFPEGYRRWIEDGEIGHDGETPEQLADRVVAAVERIAASHPGECVLVVSHGGAMRAVLNHAGGASEPTRIGNCTVARVSVDGARFTRLA